MRYVIRGGKATSRGRRGLTRAPSPPPGPWGRRGVSPGREEGPGAPGTAGLSTGPGPNTCLQSETVSAFFCFSAWVGLG